jgi:hypothetical protein
MVARHRASARQARHSKTLIRLSYKGTESFWILEFLSDQTGLSVVGHVAHGLTLEHAKSGDDEVLNAEGVMHPS